MTMPNRTSQAATPYAPPARWLHWIMAALVLCVIPAGFVMMNMDDGPAQNRLFDLHRSIGFTILCLAVVRVAVRVANGRPPHLDHVPGWQWIIADTVHYALYALIFIMPLLGWLGSNAFGSQVSVFGLFTLPTLVAKDDALSDLFNGWHVRLAFVMTALVALHILAALYHAIIRRDGVLARMVPSLNR